MKRIFCVILSLALLLCGCGSAEVIADPTENETQGTVDVTEGTEPQVTIPSLELPTAGEVELAGTGCVRVEYSGNVSSVRYITSVDQLPTHEALAAYDAAYFENKALVIVYESVNSGSIRVDIASIDNGVVTLSHEMPGELGTADMATWMLWAEVDAGLACEWKVANPALKSDAVTH